jgi:MoaA/NifB/PqqE/SkfB family radical SAM enzyme
LFKKIDNLSSSFFSHLVASWIPYPRSINIEPINICQLKCPLCPTGARKLNYDPMMMSLETFKIIIAKVAFVKTILLHKAGEPFLNPETVAMVRHARAHNFGVIISTNFSFSRPDSFFDDLVQSGLNRLVVSLDGASPESYARYRIGGNHDLVVSNIKKLIAAKNRIGSRQPEIVWQFLVNRFNEAEIGTARDISRQLGITLDLRPMDISDNLPDVELENSIEERKKYWLGENREYICERYHNQVRYPVYQGICPDLFTTMTVTVDGKVLPCCESWDKNSVFGDLLNAESFEDIWFNEKYVNSRLLFLQKDFRPGARTVCFRCKNYGTSPSFKDKLNLLKTSCGRYVAPWIDGLRRSREL